jgi:hypothetical protein
MTRLGVVEDQGDRCAVISAFEVASRQRAGFDQWHLSLLSEVVGHAGDILVE